MIPNTFLPKKLANNWLMRGIEFRREDYLQCVSEYLK